MNLKRILVPQEASAWGIWNMMAVVDKKAEQKVVLALIEMLKVETVVAFSLQTPPPSYHPTTLSSLLFSSSVMTERYWRWERGGSWRHRERLIQQQR